ncbi:hypothetical protein, partial [Aeromonas rivipollensis]|uniref:hypothetical protein n=1 Tax=Aeromonas rivipollensis TaxID=948519 RepID=UPI003D1E97A7
RSRWSGNGVHVEPESVFMIGRNMQSSETAASRAVGRVWGSSMNYSDNELHPLGTNNETTTLWPIANRVLSLYKST